MPCPLKSKLALEPTTREPVYVHLIQTSYCVASIDVFLTTTQPIMPVGLCNVVDKTCLTIPTTFFSIPKTFFFWFTQKNCCKWSLNSSKLSKTELGCGEKTTGDEKDSILMLWLCKLFFFLKNETDNEKLSEILVKRI